MCVIIKANPCFGVNMKRKRILGSLTLVLVALIWGVAFTAQSEAMKYIEPFTFNTARSLGRVLIRK